MLRNLARLFICQICLWLLMAGCSPQDDPSYVAEIDAWHGKRIENLRSATGWLTLVGLHPLGQGGNRLGSAADCDVVMAPGLPPYLGELRMVGEGALFQPAPGVVVHPVRDGLPVAEIFAGGALRTDGQGEPDILSWGSFLFHVIQRGEKFFLRVKDTEATTLREFDGVDRYAVSKSWRVNARLEGEPGTMRVANVLGQVAPEPTPGTLVFELAGKECRLRPTGKPGGKMFVVFGDASNGQGTYPGGRFLVVDPPDDDGEVVLDFNRAYNPPCVFSHFATCPLPGLDNTLSVAVTAGEKMWDKEN